MRIKIFIIKRFDINSVVWKRGRLGSNGTNRIWHHLARCREQRKSSFYRISTSNNKRFVSIRINAHTTCKKKKCNSRTMQGDDVMMLKSSKYSQSYWSAESTVAMKRSDRAGILFTRNKNASVGTINKIKIKQSKTQQTQNKWRYCTTHTTAVAFFNCWLSRSERYSQTPSEHGGHAFKIKYTVKMRQMSLLHHTAWFQTYVIIIRANSSFLAY